jgi:hypothetical protein
MAAVCFGAATIVVEEDKNNAFLCNMRDYGRFYITVTEAPG